MRSKIIFLLFLQILLIHGYSLKKHQKILNGQEAKKGQFPYQALILTDGTESYLCGGSIIHKRWILTAASCKGKNPLLIMVGASNLSGYGGPMTFYSSEVFVAHEDYRFNNIALVRLTFDVEFNEYVKPIHLPKFDLDSHEDHAAVVSGWGITSLKCPHFKGELHYIEVDILSNERCLKEFERSNKLHPESHICTSTKDGKSVFLGDDGGPVVVDNVQYGVVAFGESGDLLGRHVPNLHTKVFKYVDWIKSTLKSFNDDLDDVDHDGQHSTGHGWFDRVRARKHNITDNKTHGF